MNQCKHCNKDVPQTSKRERLYCNDKCRMAFKRSNSEQPITNKSITNKPIANKPEQDIVQPEQNEQDNRTMIPGKLLGKCKVCGEPQPHKLVDICYKCVAIKYSKIKQGNN